uniref:ABC transmembrane type-1 domain-containing protein n=1 Tax=Biomphalaria glabrata TaxID=6526 RepID=A0A2C9JXX7_BIOGL
MARAKNISDFFLNKALTISNSAKKGSTVGEIVNLMSVDCQRIQEILTMFFFMWTTPLQILLSVILLYLTIGPSVLVGVGLLILLVPVNTWIGSKQKLIQESMLAIKDSRIKLVNEILNGMKVLKLYAWETQFKNKVEAIRNKEVVQLYKIALLYVLSGLCWGVAPYVVGMLTFATYVLSDRTNVLDPQKAFVSLALFNLLRVPLNYVSTIIIYTVQIFVSIKRINKFLTRPDLDETNTTWDPNALNAVVIRSGRFTWDREYGITLKNINLTITPVSTSRDSVSCQGSPAYVSQQAWIQNATVRDNILFGKKYNKRRYDLVVKACELERDFQILEAGDQTEIGEKGINLSGGQKQRINLARAVYSDSDLYLFDDPLSAVDAHVGKAIFKNVMSQKGLLAKKTRVLVTHGVHWLPQVNKIVVMSKGTISEQGTYEQLLSHNGAFAQFLEMYLADTKCPDESDNDIELNGVKKAMKSVVDRITSDKSGDEMNYFTDDDRPNRRLNRQRSSTSISQPIHIHESIDLSSTLAGIEKSVHPVGGKLILEEKLETGKVKT